MRCDGISGIFPFDHDRYGGAGYPRRSLTRTKLSNCRIFDRPGNSSRIPRDDHVFGDVFCHDSTQSHNTEGSDGNSLADSCAGRNMGALAYS